MKIDTSKNGLNKYFRTHEIIILQIFLEKIGASFTSREIWSEANKRLKTENISRATVINFLENVSKLGLLEKKVETCRGGTRGLYALYKTESEIRMLLLNTLFSDIQKEYIEYFGKTFEFRLK